MSTAVWTNRVESNSLADSALKAAAHFWFVVAVIGLGVNAQRWGELAGPAADRRALRAMHIDSIAPLKR